jgi:bacillolysin
VVNLDDQGNVLSATGEALPELRLSVSPAITVSEARTAAVAAVAKEQLGAVRHLEATSPRLWLYDSRLLGGPGLGVPTLVWRMDVEGEADGPVDELVLVDARLGNVVLHFSQIEDAKNRRVCDANSSSSQYPCTSPVRTEGGAASGIADVNAAYDFSGDTYDFFFNNFGRDSLDGSGMTLDSTVRFCPRPSECPYQNAFWDGAQMVYGAGFAVDDVVGHELTHGVTEFTSHLFYYYQSGAINEAISDIFGEYVDLTNTAGTDTTGTRWLLGEDIPGIGAIRDMEHPPSFGDPDKMTSPNYTADLTEADAGGVHQNSGVANKAAFLMTDGATFNGQSVTGLGIAKASRIWYEAAANMLTSASDYADLATALPQACTNLVGTAGITAADCTEVSQAVAAVEMNVPPPAAPNPEAPVCTTGSPTDLFFDDLENTTSGNWVLQTGSGTNEWYYPQNSNPYGFDATYATSGDMNFWGYNRSAASDYSITKASNVAIPSGSTAFLRFRHAYGFEDDPSRAYDGGVLEYSTNNGSTWNDASALFQDGGYSGTIATGFGNPLAGRSAFVRESNGYISSRVNLSSLAGMNVRFRFRIGTDTTIDDVGWFFDDIRVYTCSSASDTDPPETTITSGPSGPTNDTTPTFGFTSDEPGSTFQCRVDSDPFTSCPSPHTTGVLSGGPHTFEVKAKDGSNNEDPTAASRSFSVDTDPPETTITSGPPASSDDSTPTFTFSSDEGGSSFACRVNGSTFAPCSSPHTTASLPPGVHTFEVVATDPAGNQDPTADSESFTVTQPPPPAASLSIGDATKKEPDRGKKAMSFTVTLSAPATEPTTLGFATRNVSAKAPKDFVRVTGTLTFAPGTTSQAIKVPIRGDVKKEKNETFSVVLSGSSGATLGDGTGTGKIKNDDR